MMAITVQGKVGEVPVAHMLADFGATICVVAESLVPERVTWRGEVWITTIAGEEPCSYPTTIVVGGRDVQLYAAIALAGSMPFQVILSRHIPGLKVTWSLKNEDESQTLVELEKSTATPPISRGTPCESNNKEVRSRVILKWNELEKYTERKKKTVTFGGLAEAAGDSTSQVVEESAWKVPLSPSGQEMHFREDDVNESLQANQAVPIITLPNVTAQGKGGTSPKIEN